MNAFCYLLALSAEYGFRGTTHVAINRAVNAMRTVIILICTEAINLPQSNYNSEYKLQVTIDCGTFG